MKVYLKYCFIFDPEEAWTNKENFEGFLAKSFQSVGMKTEKITGEDERPSNMLYVRPATTLVEETPDKSVKQVKADLTRNRGYDGKFKK